MTHSLRITACLAALLVEFIVSGCGTMQVYPGDPLPPDQVALIKPGYRTGVGAQLLSVDGHELGSYEDKAEVLPGSHSITARLRIPYGGGALITTPLSLNLNAQAGHTYELFGAAWGGGWFEPPTDFTLWIEDKETETVEAGLKPERK